MGRACVPEAKEVQDTTAGKVMAPVVWDAKSFIMLDFLPKRRTVQ